MSLTDNHTYANIAPVIFSQLKVVQQMILNLVVVVVVVILLISFEEAFVVGRVTT